ncbi:hypothetical protein V8C35DRAFT_288750 [Trichoderma chlorosporum]
MMASNMVFHQRALLFCLDPIIYTGVVLVLQQLSSSAAPLPLPRRPRSVVRGAPMRFVVVLPGEPTSYSKYAAIKGSPYKTCTSSMPCVWMSLRHC